MTFLAVLQLVTAYGPTIIPLVSKLRNAIASGRGAEIVTDADWAELERLAAQTSTDIYARLGITPPPPKAK